MNSKLHRLGGLASFDTDFKKALLISVLGHVSIVLIFGIKLVLFPDTKIDFQTAVRIDMVALPDKEPPTEVTADKQAVAQPKPVAEPKPAPQVINEKPKTVPAEKPKVDRQESKQKALARLKALQQIEQDLENDKSEAQQSSISKVRKGNILSAGSSLTGTSRLQHDSYAGSISNHIKRNWNLPEWLAGQNLSAVILVKIDPRGYIIEKTILKSSQNEVFDQRVLEATERSSPVPPPPEELQEIFEIKGVQIEFNK